MCLIKQRAESQGCKIVINRRNTRGTKRNGRRVNTTCTTGNDMYNVVLVEKIIGAGNRVKKKK